MPASSRDTKFISLPPVGDLKLTSKVHTVMTELIKSLRTMVQRVLRIRKSRMRLMARST